MGQLHSPLYEMVWTAQAYCAFVEELEQAGEGWLHQLPDLLLRVHAAVRSLHAHARPASGWPAPDLEARFELYTRLRRRFGGQDAYWLEYDHWGQVPQMTGSLADDLTDIYFDLRHGLECIERGEPARAAWLWHSGYRHHWGQHLVDATRHLYSLDTRNLAC